MAMLHTKVKLFLEANSKTWEDEINNIDFNADETGFTKWTVDGLAEPSNSVIQSYENDANAAENLIKVIGARKLSYKSIQEQLDLLYHDMTSDKGNKTGEWYKHIKSVKDTNSKG